MKTVMRGMSAKDSEYDVGDLVRDGSEELAHRELRGEVRVRRDVDERENAEGARGESVDGDCIVLILDCIGNDIANGYQSHFERGFEREQ